VCFAVTFAETSTSTGLNISEYCSASGTECVTGRILPHRAAGCSAPDPAFVGAPYGMAGLCNRIDSEANSCPFPDPPTAVHANVNLTGTGIRLVDNIGMGFVYPDDSGRRGDFDATGYVNFVGGLIEDDVTANTSVSSGGTLMDITVPYVSFGVSAGICRWVTTEQWLVDAHGDGALLSRGQAIRQGSGTLCVCKDTDGSNTDCDIANCSYYGSFFQLHYFNASTATTCNETIEYQVRLLWCVMRGVCVHPRETCCVCMCRPQNSRRPRIGCVSRFLPMHRRGLPVHLHRRDRLRRVLIWRRHKSIARC
jgi:hypothetical protein